MTAADLIAALNLHPHPIEGGYFVETYRLAPPAGSDRSPSTAIYYLLTPDTRSRMHRLPGDEMFHFYLGDPVEQLLLWPDGRGEVVTLGADVRAGQRPQSLVPGGVWQGAALAAGGRFALLGTTMAPGFHAADYVTGDRATLVSRYPAWVERISDLV